MDVEEIYLKCFEIAPARLGWRTRPEIPDYKKISKALQSVEAKTHTGLLHKPHEYSRRLSVAGVQWVETYQQILEKSYKGVAVQASASNNSYEALRKRIKEDDCWAIFKTMPDSLSAVEFASALECQPASSPATWRNRITAVSRAAEVLKDDELKEFAKLVQHKVIGD